jgi:hypothetical protein
VAAAGGITVRGVDLSFTTEAAVSAAISPSTANYHFKTPMDVTTTITWNDADSVVVKNGDQTLDPVTDYHLTDINGDTALLKVQYTYLDDLLDDEYESVTLTLDFNVGDDAEFVITAYDPTPLDSTINPASATFNVYPPENRQIDVDVTWNRATGITSINDGTADLENLVDYEVVGNVLSIFKPYLAEKLTTAGQELELTIHFDTALLPP